MLGRTIYTNLTLQLLSRCADLEQSRVNIRTVTLLQSMISTQALSDYSTILLIQQSLDTRVSCFITKSYMFLSQFFFIQGHVHAKLCR